MAVGRERCNLNKSLFISCHKIIGKGTQVKPFVWGLQYSCSDAKYNNFIPYIKYKIHSIKYKTLKTHNIPYKY